MRITMQIGKTEKFEFGRLVTLRRIECSCGWRGAYFATDENLTRSITNHLSNHREHAA